MERHKGLVQSTRHVQSHKAHVESSTMSSNEWAPLTQVNEKGYLTKLRKIIIAGARTGAACGATMKENQTTLKEQTLSHVKTLGVVESHPSAYLQ